MALKGVIDVLKNTNLQEIGVSFTLADLMRDLRIEGKNVYIKLFSPSDKYHQYLREKTENTLKSIGAENIEIEFTSEPPNQVRQETESKPSAQQNPFESRKKIPGVKKVIAVASGKGGVGKSTVAVNLAAALKKMGFEVGYLDADMYGPSGPTMLGAKDKQVLATPDNKLIAPDSHGIKIMSIGLLLPSEDTPVIWRGPVLFKALSQFLFDINWGNELDYLIIDLPPGTGDIQITLGQTTEIDGAIIVTTPQDVALIDVKKGIQMFNEVQIPVLGIIENMSYFICPETGKTYEIFGKSKTENVAKQYNTEILGKIPIEPKVAEFGDLGIPVVIGKEDSDTSKAFINIANKLIEKLSTQ